MSGAMTPREIIYANLAHQNPDRFGLNFSGNRMDDFAWAGLGPSETCAAKRWIEGKLEYSTDEWGNVWFRMVDGSQSGEIFKPAIREWRDMDTMQIPDYDNPRRYDGARQAFSRPTDKFKMVFLPGWVFATSRYLRKMEIYFMDLIEYREEIERLHGIVAGLFERMIRRFGECGAEGIFFCEDLGIQDRVLIGPAMWRDIFQPHYLRLTATTHECGMKVFMHSCGYNWELIDPLAESGIDCFQFDQPAAYDLPALAAKLRQHKVALFSPVDIQKVMPTGNRALIEAEAQRLAATFRGFFIAKNYPDLAGIGVKPEWDTWAYNAFLRAAGIDVAAG